jgi:hypothetical protein
MKIYKKRALSLIVLTIFVLSFVALPSVHAEIGAPTITPGGPLHVGDIINVAGTGTLTSGSEVRVYWDYVAGPNSQYIGSGYGEPDGSYSVDVEIPVTTVGIHYVWVLDVETGDTNRSVGVTVDPSLVANPTVGQPDDWIQLSGYGFPSEEEVWITWPPVVGNLTTSPASVMSDDIGSFSCQVQVPSLAYGAYTITATSFSGETANDAFDIQATIDLSESAGPTGWVLGIHGEGFEPDAVLDSSNFTIGPAIPMPVVGDTVTVGTDGTFDANVVIPQAPAGVWTIVVDDTTLGTATGTFEIDGVAYVDVDPTFGAPGATIGVTGGNFTRIAGIDVVLYMDASYLTTLSTDSNGMISGTFSVPALSFDPHTVTATDENGIIGTDGFKVGILAVILSPVSGDSGDWITLTGVGFDPAAAYNVTLDGIRVGTGVVAGDETIYVEFNVPGLAPGEYLVVVNDASGNEFETSFTVTAAPSLTTDPSNAANKYNVTLIGVNFAYGPGPRSVMFELYNDTWSMDITADVKDSDTHGAVSTDSNGGFDAYWAVPNDLILGNTYHIKATTQGTIDSEQEAEDSVTIVEEEVEIGPTKSTYYLGDFITFRIRATFQKTGATLEIRDPTGELYFYSIFDAMEWTTVGGWKTVLVRHQVNEVTLNPYILPEDAMTGTWTWSLYDPIEGNTYSGSIEVEPALRTEIDTIKDAITNVSTGLTDVSGQLGRLDDLETGLSDLASQVGANSETLDDLSDSVANAVSQAGEAVNAAQQAVSAAQAATSAAQNAATVAQEAVSAANSAKAEAQSAKNAANQAADAADNAASAANSLSTLVYVAIGASLIAALAAIISLMQINKRIAV